MKKSHLILIMLLSFIFVGCGSENSSNSQDNASLKNNQTNYIEQNK